MTGYKLTLEQKNLLVGQQFAPNQYYNPVQDVNGDWFIFQKEVELGGFDWLRELLEAEYVKTAIQIP